MTTTETWTASSGLLNTQTQWHHIAAWGEQHALVAEGLRQGMRVEIVNGQLRTRKWTDEAGATHYRTEVVLRWNGSIAQIGESAAA